MNRISRVVALSAFLVANMAAASVYVWDAGGGTGDTNWTTALNWGAWQGSAANTVPLATDGAVFSWTAAQNKTITLPGGTTTVASLSFVNGGSQYAFANSAATLSVTGLFSSEGVMPYVFSPDPVTFAPVLNLTGALRTFRGTSYYQDYSGRIAFSNSGNYVGGGISALWDAVRFVGDNTTINGGIVVQGNSTRDYFYNGFGYGAGVVDIAGAGTVFGAGQFALNRYGAVDLEKTTDLSSITGINFNGGVLRLRGAGNTFNGGITNLNVASGMLFLEPDALSVYMGTITLGRAHDRGTLGGGTYYYTGSSYVNHPITHDITLDGLGGIVRAHMPPSGSSMTWYCLSISGGISGSGMLIKTGNARAELTSALPNAYSGGTIVAGGQLHVGATSSLGTGNVVLAPASSALLLTAATNLAPGATILAPKSGAGYDGVLYSSTVYMQSGSFVPPLDSASDGIVAIYGTPVGAGSPLATALGTAPLGNGKMWLGGQNWGYYNGTSLAPGLPDTPGGHNVYRFSSGALNPEAHLVLMGPTSSLLNDVGGVASDVYVYNGGVLSNINNSFTGTLTVRNTLSGPMYPVANPFNYSGVVGFAGMNSPTGTAFGASSGDVRLISGSLTVRTWLASPQVAAKDNLSFSGLDIVALYSGSPGSTYSAEINFASLSRQDRGTLIVCPMAGNGLGVGGNQKMRVSGMANDANGMAPAYIVAMSGNNTGDFLTYNVADGFTRLGYMALPTSGGAGSEIAQTSGQTLTGNVSVHALRADGAITGARTVTVGSGGIIFTGANIMHTTSFKGGSAGNKELVVWCNDTSANWSNRTTISGQLITTGGLTFSGPGLMYLDSAVDNSSTLFGDITINGGRLAVAGVSGESNTTPVSVADRSLGAPANRIILNGGQLCVASTGYMAYNHHEIKVGPAGGSIGGEYNGALYQLGTISDLDPANPGYLVWMNNTNFMCAPSTFSGTSIIKYGSVRLMDSGMLGTGPVVIDEGGVLMNYRSTPVDMHASAVTVVGSGMLQLSTSGMSIGSLRGSGSVVWGEIWTAPTTLELTVGSDDTSTDFYGEMYDCEGRTGSLTKVGAGTLTLWTDVNWHGPTIISGGTLAFNGHFGGGTRAASGGITVENGGTLSGTGTIEGRNVVVKSGGLAELSGTRFVGGGIQVNGGVAHLGSAVNPSSIEVHGGTATVSNTIVDGGLYMTGGTYSGTSTANDWSEIDGGTITGSHTFEHGLCMVSWNGPVAVNADLTVNGDFYAGEPGAAVTINGKTIVSNPGGYAYLTGSMTGVHDVSVTYMYLDPYAGGDPTSLNGTGTINAGWFVMYGNSQVNGTMTFNAARFWMYGGAINGNHTIHGDLTVGPNGYAVIAPHNGTSAGTLTVAGDVTLTSGTTLSFLLGEAGVVGAGVNDLIDVTGSLTLDGTLDVSALPTFCNGRYRLFNYTGALTDNGLDFGVMPDGLVYGLDFSAPGAVDLVVVPEPATLVMLAMGSLAMIRRRK